MLGSCPDLRRTAFAPDPDLVFALLQRDAPRTWGWARTRRYGAPFNDPESLSQHQSCPVCITDTRGYDFRERQVSKYRASKWNGDRCRADLIPPAQVQGARITESEN